MSNVFVAKTTPESVIKDTQRLLRKAAYLKSFKRNTPIVIKLNLSWTRFYPACSTWPWQLEGVVKTMIEDGINPKDIIPVENKTVVTDVVKGSQNNKWLGVLNKFGVKIRYLTDEPYITYHPKSPLLVMGNVFHKIGLPKLIIGKNMFHLPTMKMHVFTTTTGSMKNYFGVLNTSRHYAHRNIHETLVDLLTIQQEIHPGIFALMDGTTVGVGSGPRAMNWEIKNYLLASSDSVALDATAARMMGFNFNSIDYLRLANERKLGNADPKNIKIVGSNISKINWHYKRGDTFASRGQKLIYHHAPLWFEKFLLQSPLVPWSYLASNLYHDYYWWQMFGKSNVDRFLKTSWGNLFKNY